MDIKHFSHEHGLVPHHPPQGSEITCSGCKSPASGEVHVCWKCNFFLHGQCFRAPRSLKHPSHPPHPLTLVPLPTYPSATFICNTCHVSGDGFSYSCSACEFDIHVNCALLPNMPPNPHVPPHTHTPAVSADHPNFNLPIYPPPTQTSPYPTTYPPIQAAGPNPSTYPPPHHHHPHQPQNSGYPPIQNSPNYPVFPQPPTNANPPPPPQTNGPTTPPPKPPSLIKHFSHPHVLKPMEVEQKNAKVCSACECELSGSAYCCTEPHCSFNLHKACFESPREVRHKSHLQHPLTLLDKPPYGDGFTCNACLKDGKAFVYTCGPCSYDLHIDCVQWPDAVKRPDHEHNLTLYYSSPAAETADDVTFMCDVCKNPVHELAWVYHCRECDFGTHLECVTTGIKKQGGGADGGGKSEEELIRETELKFAVLQLLLQAQGRKAAIQLI